MRCSDSCFVCRICVMEVGLASWSSFSSLPSSSCYSHRHQRNHTLLCTRAHLGPLHPTGASTNTRLEHKNSFSILPGHIARGLVISLTLLISSMSSSHY